MAQPIDNPAADWFERSRKSWAMLAQAAVWVIGVIAGFLVPPPVGTPDEGKVWVHFAQFAITIVIGLVLLAALRWNRGKHAFVWGGVSLMFLILGTAMFFNYQLFAERWTAQYNLQRVVIGSVFTPFGQDYHNQNPQFTRAQLVMDAGGQMEKIWTRESIEQRRIALAAMYVLAMPLFAVCIMSIVQAVHCATLKATRRKKPASRPATPASPQ